MPRVGIVGFGSFGRFLCEKLLSHAELCVYDEYNAVPVNLKKEINDVLSCDYLILAIPLESYEEFLSNNAKNIPPSTVIVDISSVKTKPVEIVRKFLKNSLIATHPLFGPQSASVSLVGHTLVMCPEVSDDVHFKKIKDFATSLGLNVIEKSTTEHDQEMAFAQGLTFFVARALMSMNIHSVELQTPSYQKLLALAELESHHSDALFKTIQQGNPYTKKVREDFKQSIQQILTDLDQA